MKIARLWTALMAGALFYAVAYGQSGAPAASEPVKVTVNIERQAVREALRVFGEQTGVQVLFRSEGVTTKGVTSQRVVGQFSAQEALERLLTNTGLKYEFVNAHTVRISSARASSIKQAVDPDPSTSSSPDNQRADEDKSYSPSPGTGEGARRADEESKNTISEIIVTAQKREERLQDVPVPVTVVSAASLIESNQLRLQDYYIRIPGLAAQTGANGQVALNVRGLTTGAGNPTVGVTIDDVPYGSSTNLGGGTYAADIDPSDLERIELLRGPQGTLYGVSSIGGILKYETIAPSLSELTGHIQSDVESIHNGNGVGYGVRAGVNVPLSDQIAIRVSVFARRDPGYIDNVVTGVDGANKGHSAGGRLAALWRPSESFSLKLSALIQDTTVAGSSFITPSLGDLEQDTAAGGGGYHKRFQAYSATVNSKLGPFELTSVTGYSINRESDSYDYTSLFEPFAFDGGASINGGTPIFPGFNGFGVKGTVGTEWNMTHKFSEELRLSAPIGTKAEWLIGAFYTREKSDEHGNVLATDPVTGRLAGAFLTDDFYPTSYEEYAAFTDLTYHFTDQFDVQIGGRESENRQKYQETFFGPIYNNDFLGLPDPLVNPPIKSKNDSFTYLLTPRFKFSADAMVYARIASGYRSGGPNSTSLIFHTPTTYKPDSTENYELGFKGSFLDQRVTVDTSFYYVKWKDIQISVTCPLCGGSYTANGTRAKSDGVEMSIEGKPVRGLTLSAWFALNAAELTQDLPSTAAYGRSADHLPFSSRLSGRAAADWQFPIVDRVDGFIGASVSYSGDQLASFLSRPSDPTVAPVRTRYGGFAQTDLLAGATFDSWRAILSVTNVTDKRAAVNGGLGGTGVVSPLDFVYIRPRTVDLSVSKSF